MHLAMSGVGIVAMNLITKMVNVTADASQMMTLLCAIAARAQTMGLSHAFGMTDEPRRPM